eukprot:scaffold88620_cov60-Phaeocystis_antarctica.AAC.1
MAVEAAVAAGPVALAGSVAVVVALAGKGGGGGEFSPVLDLGLAVMLGDVTIATGVCVALVSVTTCGVWPSPSFTTAAGGEGLWTFGNGGSVVGLRPLPRSLRTASCIAARTKLSATAKTSATRAIASRRT